MATSAILQKETTVADPGPVERKKASPVPQWLADLGIKKGQYFTDSKLRAKRAMKSACFGPVARLHICLGLHTMGFRQELAVKVVDGERVPLQPADVCAMTGISRNHFREAIRELEYIGLGRCDGLTKNRFLLYSWAVPRPVEVPKIVPDSGTIFEGCPPELASILKHYRIKLPVGIVPDSGTIAELKRLAEAAQTAELSLRTYADCLQNGTPLNKEERIERIEETVSQSVSSELEEEPTTVEPATDRLTDIEAAIPDTLKEALFEKPSLELLRRIDSKLDGAPTERLTQRIHQRLKTIKSLGIIVNLAEDVGMAFRKAERERQATESVSGARAAPSPQTVEYARQILNDTEASDHDKEFARTILAAATATDP